MKKYLARTWIDPRLSEGRSSINGRGIITTAPIKEGEIVMIWGGKVFKKGEYDEIICRIQSLVPINDEEFLGLPSGDTTESIDEYLNHSCDPNCWLVDEVTVVARRNIQTGDEVTVDCCTWDADEEWAYLEDPDVPDCNCKSELCRKILTPKDWQQPELQSRYAGHFSPYIQKKIAALKNTPAG